MGYVRWIENKLKQPAYTPAGAASSRAALRFWRGAPFYAPTPLVRLPGAAAELGLGEVYVKDEGRRFGFGAFKVLGAGYAMACALCGGEPDWGAACRAAPAVFYTATDGNHGKAVARMARLFGCGAAVLMPEGSAAARYEAIAAEGASVTIEDANYDECVRRARDLAARRGGILLQDTDLPGYEALPLEIMRGYSAMFAELAEQLEAPPTHVFLQAGVGSFAGAAVGALAELYPEAEMTFLVAEAAAAPCLLLSAGAGEIRTVGGELRTIMAGLACGEPCSLGLRSLLGRARFFAALPDGWAADAVRAFAREGVTAGESGAAGYGLLRAVMLSDRLLPLRAAAGLDGRSRVLLVNTETATDPVSYEKILGNFTGQCASNGL